MARVEMGSFMERRGEADPAGCFVVDAGKGRGTSGRDEPSELLRCKASVCGPREGPCEEEPGGGVRQVCCTFVARTN